MNIAIDSTITISDLKKFIELIKYRAELDFKKRYLILSNGTYENINNMIKDIDNELLILETQIGDFNDKFSKVQLLVVMPKENKINEFNEQLKNFKDNEIFEGLKNKKGRAYEILAAKGTIIKENFDNRVDVAKVNIFVNGLTNKNKEIVGKIHEIIKNGSATSNILLENVDEQECIVLTRLLKRIGIEVKLSGNMLSDGYELNNGHTTIQENSGRELIEEVSILIENKKIWVANKHAETVLAHQQKLKHISTRIQLRNAERQIKVFNDDEEKEFDELQQNYLNALKELDEILKNFNEEEKELIIKI